jgi:hypothetical protein
MLNRREKGYTDVLLVVDEQGNILKRFPVPFEVPPGWRRGTARQYIHSAEMVTDNYGRRSVAAGWVLGNRELILDHVHPKE